MVDSELFPPTITMSQAMVASQTSNPSDDHQLQLKNIAAPHHLSIVTKVTEPRPHVLSSFANQNKRQSNSKHKNEKLIRRNANGSSAEKLSTSKLKETSMASVLRVEQVKV